MTADKLIPNCRTTKTIGRLERWDNAISHLEEFIRNHGTANVPQRCASPDGYRLGQWVNRTRMQSKKGSLSEDRWMQLNQYSGWEWTVSGGWKLATSTAKTQKISQQERWANAIVHLEEFVREHGTAYVPQKYVSPSGFGLGEWAHSTRELSKKNRLSVDRTVQLNRFPGWNLTDVRHQRQQEQWENAISHLEEFVRDHGTACVPIAFVAQDGYPLGRWAGNTRFNSKKGRLSEERTVQLDQFPGWEWTLSKTKPLDVRQEERWENAVSHLEEFSSNHGTAYVPREYVSPDGYPLGRWANTIRMNSKRGFVSEDKLGQLDEFPGWKWYSGRSKSKSTSTNR